jgi:hypothetical protein
LVGAFLLSQQAPSVSEDLKKKMGAMISHHLRQEGVETAQFTFNPSVLLNQTPGAEGMEQQHESSADNIASKAHKD